MAKPLYYCGAIGCTRRADWVCISDLGDMFLCEFHGGADEVDGWVRLCQTSNVPGTRRGHGF